MAYTAVSVFWRLMTLSACSGQALSPGLKGRMVPQPLFLGPNMNSLPTSVLFDVLIVTSYCVPCR